ncbi:MAG: class II aldolase/adducin family protein [Bacteroidales bacterium]|jgi:L-fuculose-phosphate aldolase|nr:class II aldolase/adducin family protein [Bacteroidales bacterium]MCU0408673.1 class II aldolase/adducin family protein [Bacteroidales bacterium]
MTESEEYRKERKEVAGFMRRLYRQQLTTTSGGNISCRLNDEIIALTPSATDKGRMNWKEVALIGITGENHSQGLRPSIESEMHLAVYRKHPGVNAIVHAHPLFATAFTAMKCKIETNLTAEACAILGEPVFVPYALMGSAELAEAVSENLFQNGILLLENHGIVAAGQSLLQAFDRLEVLENAARMTFITESMGKKSPLTPERVNEINRLFR